MKQFSLLNTPLSGKTVLVRVDYNVPLKDGKIADPAKIKASLPTLRLLLSQHCKLVILTHLGRPGGKVVSSLRVKPLAQELQKLLPGEKISVLHDCIGKDIQKTIAEGKQREIFVLENLRFYRGEEENNPVFAHSLAQLGEIYVNDAFADLHRKHASIHALPQFLPSLAGLLVEKELHHLRTALHPKRPAVWILGGAKFRKILLLAKTLKKADYIVVGGAMAFPFLRAQGISVGVSKIDKDAVDLAKAVLKKSLSKKIILPLDFAVAENVSSRATPVIVPFNRIGAQQIALDIGPETIDLFRRYLRRAQTIVWNGPLGYFEWAAFAKGTKEIGRAIGKLTAISIVGGGETAEAVHKFRLEHNFTHISTGGGASLAFLAGEKLPGLIALEKSYKKYRKKYR